MKALIIGLGSIGQRHLRNMIRIIGNDLEIIAFRQRGLQITFSDTMQVLENEELDKKYKIVVYNEITDAIKAKPDVAFVTTITSKHVEIAKKILNSGIDVFIEKPLSHSLDGIGELISLRNKNKCIAFVGFQNRFNPCVKELKKIVESKEYGVILSIQAEIGERLSTMHRYEDYSGTYMANKTMGGGVVVNQLIHELDYLQWIFGVPDEVYSVTGKRTELNIDVEDTSDAIFRYHDDIGDYSLMTHADFLQYPARRTCKVIFEKAIVEIDIINNELKITNADEVKTIDYGSYTRNDMFMDELKEFLKYVKMRKQECFTIEEGINSLIMATAINDSAKSKSIIKVKGLQI